MCVPHTAYHTFSNFNEAALKRGRKRVSAKIKGVVTVLLQ